MATHHITVLGTGDMGGAIAQALSSRTKHLIAVRGSKSGSASATTLSTRLGVPEATDADIARSDIVFVVVPAVHLARDCAYGQTISFRAFQAK